MTVIDCCVFFVGLLGTWGLLRVECLWWWGISWCVWLILVFVAICWVVAVGFWLCYLMVPDRWRLMVCCGFNSVVLC